MTHCKFDWSCCARRMDPRAVPCCAVSCCVLCAPKCNQTQFPRTLFGATRLPVFRGPRSRNATDGPTLFALFSASSAPSSPLQLYPPAPSLIPYGLWRSLLPAPHCSLMLALPLALTLANHAPCAEPAAALIHRPRPTILAPVRYVCSMQYVTQRNMNAGRARWEAQPGGGAVRSGAGTRGGRPPARFAPTPSSSGCQCTPGS